MRLLASNPTIMMLIPVGIIVGLSDDFLYANSQYILAKYDVDHENDGAYAWTRTIIENIGYMFMPALW